MAIAGRAYPIRPWIGRPIRAAAAATPFAQTSWPTPRRVAFTPQSIVQQPNIGLLGTLVVATPFVGQFWPLPPKPQASAPQPVAQRSPALLGTPFVQEDWPLPRRLLYVPPPLLQQVNQLFLTPAAQVQPFAQLEWPTPKRPAAPMPASFVQQNLALFYGQSRPFAQLEWAGAKRVPFAPQPIVQQASVALLGTLVIIRPFAQASWPAPPLRPYVSIEWIHSNLALGVPVTGVPFAQSSWPAPVQRPYVSIEWIHSNYVLGAPAVVADVPIRPSVPVAPVRRVTTIQGLVAQSEIVLSGQVRPFAQTGWPVPTPPKQLVQHVFQRNLLLYRRDLLPFAQFDWPLPRIPQYPTSRYGWIDVSKPSLRAFVPPTPFAQYSWPLPRIPLYPFSLYGYEYGIEPLPGRTARPPPPPPEPSSLPTSGYESQIGVWHGGNVRHGRTGKRYRVYR